MAAQMNRFLVLHQSTLKGAPTAYLGGEEQTLGRRHVQADLPNYRQSAFASPLS